MPTHFLEHFRGWRLHHFPREPIPMLNYSFSEEIFPNIQPESPIVQLEAIFPCPVTDWEKRLTPTLPQRPFR